MKTKKLIIQFVGKRQIFDPESGKEKMVAGVAPTVRINGNRTIVLPPDEVQKKGFTHKDAEFLLKNYRSEFKRKVRKGKEI